jgi:hypothetical protein
VLAGRLEFGCNLSRACASTSEQRKNRLRCAVSPCPRQTDTAFIECEVHDDDERKPDAKCGQSTGRGEWAGDRSDYDRSDVGVGLFRKSREGSLQSRGLRGTDQLLHQVGPLAGGVEGDYGIGGEPCGDGGSDAGDCRDFDGDPAGRRAADAAGGTGSVSVPGQSLGIGVGHGVDMGTAGSGSCIAWACCWAGWPCLGHRRLAGAAVAVLSFVVTWGKIQCECQW